MAFSFSLQIIVMPSSASSYLCLYQEQHFLSAFKYMDSSKVRVHKWLLAANSYVLGLLWSAMGSTIVLTLLEVFILSKSLFCMDLVVCYLYVIFML